MFSRKRLGAALAAVILGLATAASIGASVPGRHTMHLTFSKPVSLPGVSLGSGTYVFELLDHSGHKRGPRAQSRRQDQLLHRGSPTRSLGPRA
jgi:hypothetical protein